MSVVLLEQEGMEGCELIDPAGCVPVGYYIAPRRGLRGGKVTWEQMARWLDVRTLRHRHQRDSLWVLFGRLGLDELNHVKEFCADQTSIS